MLAFGNQLAGSLFVKIFAADKLLLLGLALRHFLLELGAAGGVEAVYSVLAIRDQIAPPTINLHEQDFDSGCDLDYCANEARKTEIRAVASNSFGFGGTNGTLVFKRYES